VQVLIAPVRSFTYPLGLASPSRLFAAQFPGFLPQLSCATTTFDITTTALVALDCHSLTYALTRLRFTHTQTEAHARAAGLADLPPLYS
jgi:hypothetical protein